MAFNQAWQFVVRKYCLDAMVPNEWGMRIKITLCANVIIVYIELIMNSYKPSWCFSFLAIFDQYVAQMHCILIDLDSVQQNTLACKIWNFLPHTNILPKTFGTSKGRKGTQNGPPKGGNVGVGGWGGGLLKGITHIMQKGEGVLTTFWQEVHGQNWPLSHNKWTLLVLWDISTMRECL